MTDLRTRLADALAECFDQNNITVGTHHPAIVADVLLSLPGIAIVDTESVKVIRVYDQFGHEHSFTAPRAKFDSVVPSVMVILAAANTAEEGL